MQVPPVSLPPASEESPPPARAVYGLRLVGADGAGMLPHARDEPWPEVRVEYANGDADGEWHLGFGARRACFRLPEGLLRLEREHARMTVRTEFPLPEDKLVHPWITSGAAMFGRWHGRDAFHGGGFVAGDGAWAVLATQAGGKSTLLACLARNGQGVVSDDLLVLEHGHVFAGARCVDLRPGTAKAIGAPGLSPTRGSTRRRLTLAPVPGCLPLHGVVHLAWGDQIAVVPVPLSDRIVRLRAHNGFGAAPASPSGLLELAGLPTLELRRPRNIDALGGGVEALLAAIAR